MQSITKGIINEIEVKEDYNDEYRKVVLHSESATQNSPAVNPVSTRKTKSKSAAANPVVVSELLLKPAYTSPLPISE